MKAVAQARVQLLEHLIALFGEILFPKGVNARSDHVRLRYATKMKCLIPTPIP